MAIETSRQGSNLAHLWKIGQPFPERRPLATLAKLAVALTRIKHLPNNAGYDEFGKISNMLQMSTGKQNHLLWKGRHVSQ